MTGFAAAFILALTAVSAAAPFQKVDPAPIRSNAPALVIQEDIQSGGEPACAFTIRYPGHVDQEVTWPQERCSDIATRFLMLEELSALGILEMLDGDERIDVEELADTGIFYIESRFTASLFPLNAGGVAYQVTVRD